MSLDNQENRFSRLGYGAKGLRELLGISQMMHNVSREWFWEKPKNFGALSSDSKGSFFDLFIVLKKVEYAYEE